MKVLSFCCYCVLIGMLEDLERQRFAMFLNAGRFGKATFWDVGFEFLLFLALVECWKIWKCNVF